MPDRPSIAVLPFTNLSTDPDQQYLSDGITEDIITELSRYRVLFVIARNSSFRFRDKSVDMKRAGRELGVEYLVEGSLRKAGNSIRITTQLIAASTGIHLWAERYDRVLEDIFAVQDQVAQTIAATLVGRVTASGTENARRKPTDRWAAYDCFLQAMESNNRYDTDNATQLLNRAIQLDPQYAQAYAMLAFVNVWKFYVDYDQQTLNAALRHAKQALSIDDNDGLSQTIMGLVQTHLRHWDLAGTHLEKAVRLNPNSVLFADKFANWLLRVGRTQEALQVLNVAFQRDPLQPPWYWEVCAMALLREKRYDEAIRSINQKNPLQSWDHATLAIAHAYLGRDPEAREEAALVVRMQPNFSIAGYAVTAPYKNPKDLEHMIEGMRKAGLPE
jgi:adenylate cyclase